MNDFYQKTMWVISMLVLAIAVMIVLPFVTLWDWLFPIKYNHSDLPSMRESHRKHKEGFRHQEGMRIKK